MHSWGTRPGPSQPVRPDSGDRLRKSNHTIDLSATSKPSRSPASHSGASESADLPEVPFLLLDRVCVCATLPM